MVARSVARRRRVVALLKAISDLQKGDLLAVLELDELTPLQEFGENHIISKGEDGRLVLTPGWPPAPKSLKHRARTGNDLATILEQKLVSILGIGEVFVPSYQKRRRGNDLGGRAFEFE
jgi:hypothetical protein